MDISKLVAYDEVFPVELAAPVLSDKGKVAFKKIGVVFNVQSFESVAVVRAEQSFQTTILTTKFAKASSGETLTGDEIADAEYAGRIERCIAAVKSWNWNGQSFGDLGVDPECTTENKRAVFSHPGSKWIVDQIIRAGSDIANFLPKSQTSV